MSALADLFPAGDFRFHLSLRKTTPEGFFGPREGDERRREERRRWLAESPARYAGVTAEGRAALAEWAAFCGQRGWGHAADPVGLGGLLAPDFLLLTTDAAGAFRLRGGALCFPTGWALEEKLGQTIEEIHGVVPGLNVALGPAIGQFLVRLKPGVVIERDNWGLAASDELNLHPARGLPPPAPPVALERLWLRVERQAFLVLPETGAVVFGIRIELHRLDHVRADEAAASGLKQALGTMPEALAAYKRLDRVRSQVILWL